MKKHHSKKSWLERHRRDPFVKQARAEGYRSRAVYKLTEIDRRDRLLRPGMTVVELGAAPGGWTQLVAERIGPRGRVVALDVLPMSQLAGVEIIQGDFKEPQVLELLLRTLDGALPDLVISDMAPNISGRDAIDQPRSLYLAELAVDFGCKVLREGGDILLKAFQGAGFEELIRDLRGRFRKVAIRKPQASRPQSREVYILARGRRAAEPERAGGCVPA